jgi:hypothetical protein
MNKKIITPGLLVLMLVLTLFPLSTFAYSYNGSKQCDYYVEWRGTLQSDGTVYKDAFQQALTDWNNSQSSRRFVNGGSDSPGALDTYSENDGKYGNSIWYTNLSGCVTSWISKSTDIIH